MKKQIVYMVDNGEEYSDFGVLAIFSTRKKAEDYLKTQKKSTYRAYWEIEEWDLDPEVKQ